MRAIQVTDFGGYDRLQLVELPIPELELGQVLVKMTAAAINPLDDVMRRGIVTMGKKPPIILGNEGAGIVVAGESPIPIGTRVMFKSGYFLPRGGTWQEYVVTAPRALQPIPDGKSELEAAALRTGYEAAQLALTYKGGFQPGQVVLSPGVGGSVGNAVIQLALVQGASRVITSAGSSEKAKKARELGYEDVIDLSQERLRDGVARLTNNQGVDLAIDSLGGHILGEVVASIKVGGIIVLIGDSAGSEARFNIPRDFLAKEPHIIGHRTVTTPPEIREQAFSTIFNFWTEGRVKPLVARTFPLEQAAEAQRYLMEGRPFGKVLLTFE
ncbi:MAG TPA: zinc-binding alcohol dehydrogenase family protein [Ktedonobacteraceae bacterium]|nr:zinc-binding alcohol dehydrogenase family protein [Ktedonobacteraceae bacterium]